jgi:diacylglycerol kinase (ATP)
MRIALVHNESAGSENHAVADIAARLGRHGHTVVEAVSKAEELVSSPRAFDLIAVAGGDGTVGRTMRLLAHWDVPFAILPLGTANNTARTLQLEADVDTLVRGWHHPGQRPFDLLTISYEGAAQSHVSEAIGWGVFPDVIALAHAVSSPGEPLRVLEHDRRLFQSIIDRAAPRAFEVEVDGETIAGEFLLLEILNIPFIGPQLKLSPPSDPSDGLCEIVFATERDRATLLDLAQHGRLVGDATLPWRRGKRITVRNDAGPFHLDGTLHEPPPRPRDFLVTIDPARVRAVLTTR